MENVWDLWVCNVSMFTFVSLFYRLTYFETSAATGQNVNKAVECLLDKVMLRMENEVDSSGLLNRNNQQLQTTEDAAGRSQCAC